MAQTKIETKSEEAIRPTKRQKELLTFVEDFITAHGYSPSYREIMHGTGHTSVATVSLHINNLIKRGHLAKRDRSARSLEVVNPSAATMPKVSIKQLNSTEEKWLIAKVDTYFKEAETNTGSSELDLNKLQTLIDALKVLGLDGAAQSYVPRLSELKRRVESNQYSV